MTHTCHANECEEAIPPRLLMCRPHWRRVPKDLQRAIWTYYRPGQEIDKRPSRAYLDAAAAAVASVEGSP